MQPPALAGPPVDLVLNLVHVSPRRRRVCTPPGSWVFAMVETEMGGDGGAGNGRGRRGAAPTRDGWGWRESSPAGGVDHRRDDLPDGGRTTRQGHVPPQWNSTDGPRKTRVSAVARCARP